VFHIHQYIRNSKGQRIGVLLAFKKDEHELAIGWSKCNKLDQFDRTRAVEIAIGRALRGTAALPPRVVVKKLKEFEDRAKRYFFNPKGKRDECATCS
jgi:hypothetical protein